jgi:hypothetical protein
LLYRVVNRSCLCGIGRACLIGIRQTAPDQTSSDPTGSNTRLNIGSRSAMTFATLPPAVAGTLAAISDELAANCGDAACTTFGTG